MGRADLHHQQHGSMGRADLHHQQQPVCVSLCLVELKELYRCIYKEDAGQCGDQAELRVGFNQEVSFTPSPCDRAVTRHTESCSFI